MTTGLISYKRIIVFIVALIAVAILPLSLAKPADAFFCGGSRLCIFEHSNFMGAQIDYYDPIPGQCYNLPSDWINRASSVINNTTTMVTLYANPNCIIQFVNYRTLGPGQGGSWGWPNFFNDALSSFKRS